MVDLPTTCKYGCGTELVDWDNEERAFVEEDGTLHTYERCISIKNEKKQSKTATTNPAAKQTVLKDTPEIKDAKKTVILRELDKIKAMVEAY
jgi:hypothetical protein